MFFINANSVLLVSFQEEGFYCSVGLLDARSHTSVVSYVVGKLGVVEFAAQRRAVPFSCTKSIFCSVGRGLLFSVGHVCNLNNTGRMRITDILYDDNQYSSGDAELRSGNPNNVAFDYEHAKPRTYVRPRTWVDRMTPTKETKGKSAGSVFFKVFFCLAAFKTSAYILVQSSISYLTHI